MDAMAVTALLDVGMETDKVKTAAAVWVTVIVVNRVEADDRPIQADMPRVLHLVFDANMRHLLGRSKVTTNVTCMQPTELGLASVGMSYILDRPTTRPTTTLASMDLSKITLQEAVS